MKGGSHNDIKKALRQWIDLYSDDLIPDMTFELYENGKENHILKVDDRLEPESFYYLVNYLNYPEGVDYKINIEGFTTAKNIRKKQKDLVNKKLLVYISNKDTEGDNVNVVTEDNETYKIDFGGKITKVNESKRYLIPNFEINSIAEVLRFDKKENQKKKSEKSKANFEVKIISLDNENGELEWYWGNLNSDTDTSWKDFKYKFRVTKEDNVWKIAYLEGFDFKESTRKDGQL